jgi:hypothetical protein
MEKQLIRELTLAMKPRFLSGGIKNRIVLRSKSRRLFTTPRPNG